MAWQGLTPLPWRTCYCFPIAAPANGGLCSFRSNYAGWACSHCQRENDPCPGGQPSAHLPSADTHPLGPAQFSSCPEPLAELSLGQFSLPWWESYGVASWDCPSGWSFKSSSLISGFLGGTTCHIVVWDCCGRTAGRWSRGVLEVELLSPGSAFPLWTLKYPGMNPHEEYYWGALLML